MRMLVFVCGALLALALVYILLSSGPFPEFFLGLFRSQPSAQQIAWMLIIVVSVIVVASAIWVNEKLVQQRNATQLLESRLRVEEAQKDVDRATSQLGRTVPDATLRELQQRLSNAEKELSSQQRRGESGEMQALVEEIRARQDELKEKLGEAITKRKSIEQLFVDYEVTQQDIERILSGIEADQKGDALEARIRNLSQFTKITESRFHEIEQSKQTLLDLGKEFEAQQARLLPLKDDRSGVKALLHQLNDACAQLVANIETLEGTQHDIERTLSGIEADQKGDTLETRIRNLSQFTKLTESRFHEIEQSKQMILDLGKEFETLQARILPLKHDRSGVKALIHQLNDACAQLVANIETLERDGDLSLPERVKRIAENRRELSERVSSIAEELSKLDSSHKDINSLFARLSHELKARESSGREPG
jgi:chromosome segregation ATPase